MKYLLFISLITSSLISFGQTITVKGIIAADNDMLDLGTVSVFRSSDSLLVKGTYMDSNRFTLKFNGEFNGQYFAKIKLPEYSETIIEFKVSDATIDLGLITPEKVNELGTVDVVYEVEQYIRTLDGITVNVEGTNLQTLTNLFEILKASPKLSSPDDENIEIVGRGRPLILVDRQAIISSDELRAIPANQVEKVEIITNPSAKYKAQGSSNGVIEVYTKDFHLEGYSFTLSGAGGTSTQLRPAANLNLGLSLKKKKFSLSGYLGANYGSSNSFGSSNGETVDDSSRGMASEYETDKFNTWQYYNLKGAYQVSDKQRITMGINGYGSNGGNSSETTTAFFQNQKELSSGVENSENKWTWLNNSAFINYSVETDTNKSNFEINLNYTNKISNSDNAIESTFNNTLVNESNNFAVRNESKDIPNIGELRANYEHVFDTSGWKLSTGLSYSLLMNGKSLTRYDFLNDDWIKNDQQSNSYNYSEQIGALFIELTKKWQKLSARVGVRAEYTGLNGYSNSLNKQFIDSVYVLPFPNASVMWEMSEKVSATLFYKSGIERPQFDNFDPFIVQRDSLSIEYGNPFLRPSIEQTIGVDFDLFYKYSLSVTYSVANDPFSEVSFISEKSFVQETTPWNAKDKKSLNVSFSIPIKAKWLSGWNSVWSNYNQYAFTPVFGRPTFSIFTYGVYSNLTFKLPKSIDITNRVYFRKWGRPDISIAPIVSWGGRITKKFEGNKYQLYFDVENIVPPKYEQTNLSGNFSSVSTGQNRFTTFKLGFFAKLGRLKASEQIEESKSNQSGRI
ncbi:MAG: outer membrane beta-barrel protein [Crocinitomicaceae bacterium]